MMCMFSTNIRIPAVRFGDVHAPRALTPERLRAPEVVLDFPPDPKSDIWNLACVVRATVVSLYSLGYTDNNIRYTSLSLGTTSSSLLVTRARTRATTLFSPKWSRSSVLRLQRLLPPGVAGRNTLVRTGLTSRKTKMFHHARYADT